MHYLDKKGISKNKDIKACKNYLKNMVRHISSVWQIMAQEFD